MRWLVVAMLGVGLGVASAWSDVVGSGLDPSPTARIAMVALNMAATWAALAFVSGWIIRIPLWAAGFAGFASLAVAVAGYYVYGVLAGDRSEIGFAGVSGVVRLWALVAVVAGPLLGAAGAIARRPGWPGLVAALVLPAGIVVEQVGILRLDADTFSVDPVRGLAQILLLVIAGALATAAVVRFVRQRRDHGEGMSRAPGRSAS
jgi:Family of unknown function (DUF6518)